KILMRNTDAFIVHAESGLCLIELLPQLPAGRYRIDADLKHVSGPGHSWAGAYVAGLHTRVARGAQHMIVAARFADCGALPHPPSVGTATDGVTAAHAALIA